MADELRLEPDANGDRLESWKQVAAYLRRDVRTVQRWEKTDGLPVHRHPRAHRPIPYAYKAELDDWWVGHLSKGGVLPGKVAGHFARLPRRHVVAVGAAAIAAIVTAGAFWLVREYGGREEPQSTAVDRVAHVTTHSPAALKLYLQGDTLLEDDQAGEAEALLREAVNDDPTFASAHLLLAWALRNQNRPRAEYLPYAERASQLAVASTESERLFIRGSLLELRGSHKEACTVFEALAKVQPDHYWATNNVASCYLAEGDRINSAEFLSKRADLRPNSIADNVDAAWANEFMTGNPALGKRYLDRAERLQAGGTGYCSREWSDAWLRLRPAYKKWLQNDVNGALNDLLTTVARDSGRLDAHSLEDLHLWVGSFMLTLGRLGDAERSYGLVTNEGVRPGYMALVAYARDDSDRFRSLVRGYVNPGMRSAILGARLGLEERARAILAGPAGRGGWQTEALKGELTFQSGDVANAVEHLSVAVNGLRTDDPSTYFLASETLARALARKGQYDEAFDVLEAAAAERSHAYDPFANGPESGQFWMRLRLLQAELYAQRGRWEDSTRVAGEIVHLLALADPTFPILQKAKQLLNQQSWTARR